jgi:hypothetical protein
MIFTLIERSRVSRHLLVVLAKSIEVFVIFLLIASSAGRASAQIAGTGTIQGSVTDGSGALVPNAQVKIIEVKTNAERDTTTSNSGFYSVAALPNGLYKVTVSAKGFETYVQENVNLDALQVEGLNVKLNVGANDVTVTVTEAPPALNTANATLGSSMEVQTYQALPLALSGQPRDPTAFLYFTPGVTGGTVNGGSGTNQMNGGQSNLNETYIDGIAMDDVNQQSDWAVVHSTFSVDAVEQAQGQVSGISAAYQGQGLQNYVHKSGSNTFHGTAFEYFRNTALDGWGFYAPYALNPVTGKAIKPVEHNNEFGGTVGGYIPHFKNKIFFFASLETEHYIHGTNPGYQTVPTLLERTGNFTDLPATQPIYDPSTTASCTANSTNGGCRYQFGYGPGSTPGPAGNPVLTGTPNVIPAGEISPISKYMQSFLPAPSNSQVTNNYLGGFNTGFNYPRQSYKVDLDLLKNHRFSVLVVEGGRYANPACCDGSGLPLPYLATVGNTQNNLTAILTDVWTINSRTVNRLSYALGAGGFHGKGSINPSSANPAWYATAAGITNLPPGQASNSFPSTTFAGPNATQSWTNADKAGHGPVYVYHIVDGFQTSRGVHSLSAGGEFQWEESNSVGLDTGTYLSLSYSNLETSSVTGTTAKSTAGDSYASFLVGAVDSASVTDNRQVQTLYARYKNFSPYVQDDIKFTKKLTVNAGLRWDLYQPYHEKFGHFSFVNLGLTNPITGTPGALQYGGSGTSPVYCNCTSLVPMYLGNLGPRLGFAYALNDKTIVRGGFGISYSHAGGVGGRGGASSGPGQIGFTLAASPTSPNSGLTPALYLNNAPGFAFSNSAVPTATGSIDPALGTGYTTNAAYSSTSPTGVTFADPYLSRRATSYENFNFGIQREIVKHTTLSVDYSGSNGHFLATGIGRGIYSNQLNPATYVLGGLLTSPATTANIAAAQALYPGFKLPFANYSPSATIGQALRPFPQYNGFSDIWGNVGNSNYSSLQLSLKQNEWHGLSYGLSYTWAKTMDDTGSSRSAYGVGPNNAGQEEHALSTIDIPNNVTLYYVYNEPYGHGNGNRLLNQVIRDWSLSGTFQHEAGTPVVVTGSGCNQPFGGTCIPNLNPNYVGSPRINGGYGRKNLATGTTTLQYIDPAAFSIPVAYTLGNASRTYPYKLRNPGGYTENLSLRRSFAIYERLKFTFEASAFNVDGHVDFSAPNTSSFTSTPGSPGVGNATSGGSNAFGTITGQANTPRDLQFSGRFSF